MSLNGLFRLPATVSHRKSSPLELSQASLHIYWNNFKIIKAKLRICEAEFRLILFLNDKSVTSIIELLKDEALLRIFPFSSGVLTLHSFDIAGRNYFLITL